MSLAPQPDLERHTKDLDWPDYFGGGARIRGSFSKVVVARKAKARNLVSPNLQSGSEVDLLAFACLRLLQSQRERKKHNDMPAYLLDLVWQVGWHPPNQSKNL